MGESLDKENLAEKKEPIKKEKKMKENKKKNKQVPTFLSFFKKSLLKLCSNIISLFILIIFICILIFCSTNFIKTKDIEVSVKQLNDLKIVQLSDFNNRTIKNLSEKINDMNPDIVCITGDLVDEYKTSEIDENVLIKQFVGIKAPIYFAPGDMEHGYKNYEKFKEKLEKKNIHVLENKTEEIKIHSNTYKITGIVDSSFYYEDLDTWNKQLKKLKESDTQILLSHRPELMNLYIENGYKFVLSGHTHGGYIKFPFVGAIFASNQGVMPQYVDGIYIRHGTTMIVSSGIGVGQFPFRLFSLPKILNIHVK